VRDWRRGGVGLRRRLAEVCLLGGVLWVISLLPLVHGVLLPGPLYGPNPGTVVAVMVAVPAALLAALPLLLDGSAAGRWLSRRWLAWSAGSVLLYRRGRSAGGLAAEHPRAGARRRGCRDDRGGESGGDGHPVAAPPAPVRHRPTGGVADRIARFRAPGLATLAFLGAQLLSVGWWLAHFTDGLGVLFAAGGLLLAHYRDRSLVIVLAPVLAREPLAALQLGLTPVVLQFVAALQVKDEVTRQHVSRVSELAMRAGERARLDPLTLRAVGLGALLHDVGKLLTPDEVLMKPSSLTDEERAIVERHPADGAALLAEFPHLAEAAKIVRAHHERPDGTRISRQADRDGHPRGCVHR